MKLRRGVPSRQKRRELKGALRALPQAGFHDFPRVPSCTGFSPLQTGQCGTRVKMVPNKEETNLPNDKQIFVKNYSERESPQKRNLHIINSISKERELMLFGERHRKEKKPENQ